MIPSGAAGEEHKLALWAQLMRIVPGCSPKFPVASVCVCGGVELIIPMALPCAVWPASYPAWRRCIYLGERNGMPAYSISCLFKPAPSTPHKYLAAPICVRKDVTLTMCVCGGA